MQKLQWCDADPSKSLPKLWTCSLDEEEERRYNEESEQNHSHHDQEHHREWWLQWVLALERAPYLHSWYHSESRRIEKLEIEELEIRERS